MPFRLSVVLLSLLLWLLPAGNASAQLRDYRIDAEHSRVLFKVEHLGLSSSIGRFSRLEGTFRFDDEHWESARVEVRIPLDSLDLGDADWQRKVLDDYLQADKHPVATFDAGELIAADHDDAHRATGVLKGTLTLNGVTRPIELQLRYNGDAKSLYTKLKRKTGFSATTSIRRSDFGLDKQLDLVGDDVRIEIEVEGIEQRN